MCASQIVFKLKAYICILFRHIATRKLHNPTQLRKTTRTSTVSLQFFESLLEVSNENPKGRSGRMREIPEDMTIRLFAYRSVENTI